MDFTKYIAKQVGRVENIKEIIKFKKKIIEEYIKDEELTVCINGSCKHKKNNKMDFKISSDDKDVKVENVDKEFNVCMNAEILGNIIMDIKYFTYFIEDINENISSIIQSKEK